MGMRKLRAKKYKSISEYYKDSDPDKKTIAHYISYWHEDASLKAGGTTKKERINTLDREEALKILNERKAENAQKKKERDDLKESGDRSTITIDQVATEYFHDREKRTNIHRDMKRYVIHIGNCIYKTIDTTKSKTDKGFKLTDEIDTYIAFKRGVGNEERYYLREREDQSYNIGDVLIKDINADMIKRLITALEKKDLSKKTIAAILNILKAISNYAISEGYIVANPFKNRKAKVEVPTEERKRLFSVSERRELFIAAKRYDARVFMLFKLLYYTGQRPESIINLRVRDINLNQGEISIGSIKGQAATTVPIARRLFPLLRVWIKDGEPNDKLFNIVYRTFRDKTEKIFAKYNKGLDYKKHRYQWASMYSFRHTSATVMLAKTDNIKTVQSVLNHSDPKVTAIYAKLLKESKIKGVNVL